MSHDDCRGVPTSASTSDEIEAFDRGFELFLNYEMAAGAAMKQVLADHPTSAMATALRGYMMMMLESSGVHPKVAATAAAGLDNPELHQRERLHFAALSAWAGGDVRAAAEVWDQLLVRYPLDLLALKMHHYTTFWTGRANVLLSAVDGVFDAWEPSTPGYDHVLGMRAFALNETGRYEEAEVAGRDAVARNDEDLWSVHAVAHALEMQGALAGGDEFFDVGPDTWATKNPFVGHIWWHSALFPWNGGDFDRVLRIYDERLRPASTEFFLDLQNLSSLLTRLELAGVDVGDRWDELADHAAARTGDHVLTFTDVHCALTLCRTGRADELAVYNRSLEQHRADLRAEVDSTGLDVAIELCRGFEQLASGNPEAASQTMLAVRGELAPIGGSHAQRDLFDLVLTDAVEAAGDDRLAVNLLRSRTRRWPHSVPTWHRYAEAVARVGDDVAWQRARKRMMEAGS